MTRQRFRASLYALFALSGFAGLIYESIWTHYLKLFLGHAAYAQTLVLAIFMGGMALGAWLAGERSKKIRRPLVAYAVVEGVLGLLALVFDPVFRGVQSWAFDYAIPALPAPLALDALKWGLSALIIFPQSVLLGATFPLMSGGIIRVAGGSPGRVLSWLYFTNSAGAAVGVIVSGFVLISAVGLPGTILTAGLINFALVLVLWLLLRQGADLVGPDPAIEPAKRAVPVEGAELFLAAAFLTGTASFFYEIGWIRMLSLVLGSATHSFEFMLSAFITGIALGSFALRSRVDQLKEPLRFLGAVQVTMALLALMTLVIYGQTFDWMAAFLNTVRQNDNGYVLFNLFSHGVCLALMLPVTICAGMTLPLITKLLLDRGFGEASIGRVYAVNTLGSITGVLAAVHVVMPLMGLRQVIVVGAAVDLGLGLWLLWMARRCVPAAGRWVLATASGAGLFIVLTAHFDASRLASGVFRTGAARLDAEVIFHRDGKTASVDVFDSEGERFIATNGKVDATLRLGPQASADDFTMILLAALPALSHPDLRNVAVVGFGSGRTTHSLLQASSIESVDTIEIEPAMLEGARAFGELVAAAYTDPRSRIYLEDAKTFFSRGGGRYDAIISEPSNPWVSGVASLFSREFYRQARRHLNEGGLLVQWVQLYEFDLSLAGSILKALGTEFEDYAIYLTDASNILVVASASGPVPDPRWNGIATEGMGGLLAHVQVFGIQDLLALRVADKPILAPLLAAMPIPPNSDYFPVVDQHAAKYRFLNSWVDEFTALRGVSSRLGGRPRPTHPVSLTVATSDVHEAQTVGAMFATLRPTRDRVGPNVGDTLVTLKAFQAICGTAAQEAWLEAFQRIAARLLPYMSAVDATNIARTLRAAPCFGDAPQRVRQWIDFFEADANSDWPRVRTIGLELLKGGDSKDPVSQFLLAEILLARLKTGDLAHASAWLPKLSNWAADSAPVRLLMAHVAGAAESRP